MTSKLLDDTELEKLFEDASLPDGCSLTDGHLVQEIKGRDGKVRPTVLGAPLLFVARFNTPIGGVNVGIAFLDQDGNLKMLVVPAGDLLRPAIVTTLADAGWTMTDAPGVRKRLHTMYNSISAELPAYQIVTKNGMQPCHNAFLMDQRRFGTNARSMILDAGKHIGFRSAGSLETWKTDVAVPLRDEPLLAACACMSFAATIKSVVLQHGAVINLIGKTSTGKTTAVKIATSVFTDPKYGVNSWGATEAGLDDLVEKYSGFLLPIDEIKSGLNIKKTTGTLYRLAGQRTRHKANGYGGGVVTETLVLSTEEVSGYVARGDLAEDGGAVRFFDVPIGDLAGGIFHSATDVATGAALAKSLATASYKNFGTALPAFMDRLMAIDWVRDAEAILADTKEVFFSEELDAPSLRGLDVFAAFAAAGRLAVRMDVLPWTEEYVITACKLMFNNWRSREMLRRPALNPHDPAKLLANAAKATDLIWKIKNALGALRPLNELRAEGVTFKPATDAACPAFTHEHEGKELICVGHARFATIVGSDKTAPALAALRAAGKLHSNKTGFKLSITIAGSTEQFIAIDPA
jgi:hypothetical protein